MTKDEEIALGLRDSGVPEFTFRTTLEKEKATELHTLVKDRTLARASSARGIFIYPAKSNAVAQARKLFYLVAKELYLTGTSIYCIPLSNLVEALKADEFSREANKVERVRIVFILDFYEDGAGFPLTTSDAARMRAWVRKRFETGNAVSFLSDSHPDRCAAWWPQSFMGFINDNTIIHSV